MFQVGYDSTSHLSQQNQTSGRNDEMMVTRHTHNARLPMVRSFEARQYRTLCPYLRALAGPLHRGRAILRRPQHP